MELKKYKESKITLGELIAKNYNFQNIASIIDAFNWLLGIDLKDVINKDNKQILFEELGNIIERRHKIVHLSFIDKTLDLKEIIDIHSKFQLAGAFFVYSIILPFEHGILPK